MENRLSLAKRNLTMKKHPDKVYLERCPVILQFVILRVSQFGGRKQKIEMHLKKSKSPLLYFIVSVYYNETCLKLVSLFSR